MSSNAWQGPSPDEVALVEGARQLGYEFLRRTADGVTVRLQGEEATFEVRLETKKTHFIPLHLTRYMYV